MRQMFNRPIYGDAAGGDVIHNNVIMGNLTMSTSAASSLTEYEAQHKFQEATGITCTKRAREYLQYLGDRCDFTYKPELKAAVGASAMVWNRAEQRWELGAWLPDYVVAAFFGLLAVMLAISASALVLLKLSGTHAVVAILMVGATMLVAFCVLHLQFIRPHRIARRAMAALASAPVAFLGDPA